MKFRQGYYQADCQNGVTFYGELMDLDVDILPIIDFEKSLSYLDEDEIIYTFMDKSTEEFFDSINENYGIN